MKAKQVKKAAKANYPARLEALSNPKLLADNIPDNWRSSKEMAAAISILIAASLTQCSASSLKNKLKAPAVVAPVFNHGEGRGSVGCVSVAPPVFLSEEEALQTIMEELGKYGLKFTQRDVKMESITIPPRKENWEYKKDKNGSDTVEVKLTRGDGPDTIFVADALDPAKKVAIEFVAASDYETLGGPAPSSTAITIDTKEVAGYLSQQVKAKGKGLYFGAFYDPVAYPDEEMRNDQMTYLNCQQTNEAERKKCVSDYDYKVVMDRIRLTKASKDLLKLQVKDFADWLKAQGVL
jgi:hypothetical protein